MGTRGSGLADSCWFNVPAWVLMSSIIGASLCCSQKAHEKPEER